MRHNALLYSLALVLAMFTSELLAAVSASVDRSEVAMDESFTLTITVSELRVFSQPDLSPLELDFHILNTSQNSSTSIVNGKLSSSTSWRVQLMPKRPGKTSIPPIEVGKEETHTIEMMVSKRGGGGSSSAAGNDDIQLEAELSRNTVYITEQVLLTLRVIMAQSARFQLEEPELEHAIVHQVAEASYQQVRGGRRFQVTEYTFAIFPNETGELQINSLSLVAELMSSRPRSMFDPMLGNSKRILRRTEPLTVNVIPAPDGISPVDWLPASRVSLTQEWSADPNQLQVGDSITRTIELKGKGVMAAQLPPLFFNQVDGLKTYPDQPVVSDEQSASGITGKRVERIAIVATRPGHYQLPEQQVSWWNVNTNQAETALLPAVSFDVAASANAPATSPTTDIASAPTTEAIQAGATGRDNKAWYLYWQWWLICVILGLAFVLIGLLYLRTRRQLVLASPGTKPAKSAVDPEAAAYEALRSTCDSGEPGAVYQALQSWCRLYWHDCAEPDIDHLAQNGANRKLVSQANALQRQLYSSGQVGSWNPQSLLLAVDQQRKSRTQRPARQEPLPQLYR